METKPVGVTSAVTLSPREMEFLLNLLGNLVIGHPERTKRKISDSIINKLSTAGAEYDDNFYQYIENMSYIKFIK